MKKIILSSLMALGLLAGKNDAQSQEHRPRYGPKNNLEMAIYDNNSKQYIHTLDNNVILDSTAVSVDNYSSFKNNIFTTQLRKMLPEYDSHRIDSTINRVKTKNELQLDGLLENLPEYKNLPELLQLYTKANIRQESVMIRKNSDNKLDTTYFDPKAESRTGARGYFQFKEKWWPAYGTNNFDDAYNPTKNLEAGLKYTRWLWSHLSQRVPEWNKKTDEDKLKLMAAGHNGGTGTLRDSGYDLSKMGSEPQNHARRIIQYYNIYSAEKKILAEYESMTNDSIVARVK